MTRKRKIRNPVAVEMFEYTKPSRHRDRKNDYERREKHPRRSEESKALHAAREKCQLEEYLSEGEDWGSIDEGQLDSSDWD